MTETLAAAFDRERYRQRCQKAVADLETAFQAVRDTGHHSLADEVKKIRQTLRTLAKAAA